MLPSIKNANPPNIRFSVRPGSDRTSSRIRLARSSSYATCVSPPARRHGRTPEALHVGQIVDAVGRQCLAAVSADRSGLGAMVALAMAEEHGRPEAVVPHVA